MAELNSYFIKQNVTHTMITTQVGKLFMETTENTTESTDNAEKTIRNAYYKEYTSFKNKFEQIGKENAA